MGKNVVKCCYEKSKNLTFYLTFPTTEVQKEKGKDENGL
jgi:hypothetical protein